MKFMSFFFAVLLTVTPGLAGAKCFGDHAQISCETGKVWDESSQSCVQTRS